MDLVTLLSYLFGTEEEVERRRRLVLLREEIATKLHNIDEGCVCRLICSGSLGEGVAYPPSDDDIMIVKRNEHALVYDRYEEAINHRAMHMIPSLHSPGFCLIQNVTSIDTRAGSISSKQFREDFVQSNSGLEQHGPCASRAIGQLEYDFVLCLTCPRWPAMAYKWIIRRRRYGWPSPDLVNSIVRGGCHVVPIGNPDSPLCDFEWRVSFSLAERSLIHEFNHVQFIVYNLLKLILKRVIGVHVPGFLCSYFLKTTLFYAIEHTSPEIWANCAIDECYRRCLLLLHHFIDAKNCPNFFIPENNMMRRKINENNKLPLLHIISELMRCSIVDAIRLCGENEVLSPLLSYAHIELQSDFRFIFGHHLFAFMVDVDKLVQIQYGNNPCFEAARNVILPLLKGLQHFTSNRDASFLTLIMKMVFNVMGLQCINASTEVRKTNPSRYQILKCGQAMLKVGCNADVSSGKLHLANYMFMTGRFRHCIAIIQSVLSKIEPHVMHFSRNYTSEVMYMQAICNNGFSLEYKVRKAWALDPNFIPERATFASLPVKILFDQIMKNPVAIGRTRSRLSQHFLVFAYFLQGLCFFQTRDFDSMNNSVTLLEHTMKDLQRDELKYIFYGRLLLSYLKMLQQDYHSSCRCLTSAYLMKEKMEKKFKLNLSAFTQTCAILLGCLLNRIFRIE